MHTCVQCCFILMFFSQGVLGCFHTYVGSGHHYFGFRISNLNTFWGFQKNEYFLGFENFMDIFWGHHKIRLHLEVILGLLEIPVIFWSGR